MENINKIVKIAMSSRYRKNGETPTNFSTTIFDVYNVIGYRLRQVVLPITYNFINSGND